MHVSGVLFSFGTHFFSEGCYTPVWCTVFICYTLFSLEKLSNVRICGQSEIDNFLEGGIDGFV